VCEPDCSGSKRDKVVLRTTCIKNVKLKIIKTRTGCQYVGYFYYSKSLNWAAENPRLDRGLDVAVLSQMKIPNLKDSLCLGWGDHWILPLRAKRIRCLVPLAHNGSGVFGAKRLFLASVCCVKAFRSTFRAMSFQDVHWLQKLGSCKASFAAKEV